MPGYISKYVPCDFAIARIAEHHCGGDDWAACRDIERAIAEGAITHRYYDSFLVKGGETSADMLSDIVGGIVKAKGNQPVGDHELKNRPEGTWLRRELEEIYGQIFSEYDGAIPPEHPADKKKSYPGRPSQMRAIEAEMRRRAEKGELEPTLVAATCALSEWAINTFPREQIPQPRSIGNTLRGVFRDLKGKQHLIK